MNINYLKDFDGLIKVTIEIGNKLQGSKTTDDKLHLAEGLGKKVISHVLSANHLFKGYQLSIDENKYEPTIDFSSMAILTRAALETYLTFNYIFSTKHNIDETEFRFLCWDLAGFLERSNLKPSTEELIVKFEKEKKAIEKIKNELSENLIFNELSKKNQERVLKGQWRIDNSWSKLATYADFNKSFFNQEYKYLCCHAHSSRLSVIQIQQIKSITKQKEMAKGLIGVLMVILAKFIFDYVNIVPALAGVKQNITEYPIILGWKKIGERLEIKKQ